MKYLKTTITDRLHHYHDGKNLEADGQDNVTKCKKRFLFTSSNRICYPKSNIPYKLIIGLGFIVWGIFFLIYTPQQILLDERLRMMPGLPPYNWWKNPPDEVLLRAYIFNITNADAFMNGTDTKLRVKEVGPIIYREKLTHSNVTFNDNDTMTYIAKREAIFLPEMNTISLNDTIIVPNLAVLFVPLKFYDASFFTKLGVNLLIRRLNSQPIIKTTIYQYLWNISDPILDMAESIAPSLVPTKNMGTLNMVYKDFVDTVTVRIGTKNGNEKLFLIDKFRGSEYIPGYGGKCRQSVQNSTEGICYPQQLSKNDTLKYWRKTICKVMDLYYDKQMEANDLNGSRYLLSKHSYDRREPLVDDCYKSEPKLPNGLADISDCYYGAPIAVSFPHFLYGDDKLKHYVDGLTPNFEDHQSYVIVEPVTGIPLQGKARSQTNLILKPLSGFNSRITRFSNTILPLFWLEYHQVGIPWYIQWLLYFTVKIVPNCQQIFSALLLLIGFVLLYEQTKQWKTPKGHLVQNTAMKFEAEAFIAS